MVDPAISDTPISNRWWMDWFCWYAKRMVRSEFWVFAIDLSHFDYSNVAGDVPVIIYSNLPGWWDPIVGMLICKEYFADRFFYAPIDAQALEKYRVFKKLGYFGVHMTLAEEQPIFYGTRLPFSPLPEPRYG